MLGVDLVEIGLLVSGYLKVDFVVRIIYSDPAWQSD
jgi:hypothetical protein